MKEVNYEEGRALALTHVCGECGWVLVVCWGGIYGIEGYILRCGRDAQHQGFVKRGNPTRARLARMGLSPEEVENEMNTGLTVRDDRLAKYQSVRALTTIQAREIIDTIWPKAPETQRAMAIMACAQYQLNPLMKHVSIVKFGDEWSLIFGIKAKRLMAARRHKPDYVDGPRMMTAKEQETILGEVDPSNFWAIIILEDKRDGRRFPGYGNWPKAKSPFGADKGNSKANMTFIRAESNALEKMCPGEMPQGDVMAEEYMEEPGNVIGVDTFTGEILDGAEEVPEASPQPQQAAPGLKADPKSGPEASPVPQPVAQAQADPSQGKVMTPTEFWTEARKLGYDDATKTELVLGKTVPRWLRDGGTYRTALIALQAAQGKGVA